jgi:dihydropyrimidinase
MMDLIKMNPGMDIMTTLIKNGTLVTTEKVFSSDILIEGELIKKIAPTIDPGGNEETIDATGKLIMPGGIDAHVHLDLPMFGTVSSDDHYTGTKAAAFGGTTTVIDFISQDEPSLLKNIELWHAKADLKVAVDFSFHMNVTHLDKSVEQEIGMLVKEGITSVKVFTAYNNRLRLQDGEILRVMRTAARYGITTLLHAENGDVIDLLVAEALAARHKTPIWHARTRPAWGAIESSLRGCALAAIADATIYLVHMNTAGELDMASYARQHGVHLAIETCPQYLFFTEEDLKRKDGAKWICSPPLREAKDVERLWKGLGDGTIDVVSTDHCPFFYNGNEPIDYEGKPIRIPGKELGREDFTKIPNGLPGVGDRMVTFWTKGVVEKRITPQQFVALTSTNPAKHMGLFPRKGCLRPGSDADLVIWDAEREITYGRAWSWQRTDYNLYEGWRLKGFPEKVFLRGKCIVDGRRWLGKAGGGKFLFRKSLN